MRSRADNDFATPLRRNASSIALEIDGRAVSVPEGTSVIRAAAEAGIHIPKLCATDSLDCLTCPANGNCELQDMAGAVGLREVRYRNGDGANHLHAAKDESNPYFTFH